MGAWLSIIQVLSSSPDESAMPGQHTIPQPPNMQQLLDSVLASDLKTLTASNGVAVSSSARGQLQDWLQRQGTNIEGPEERELEAPKAQADIRAESPGAISIFTHI